MVEFHRGSPLRSPTDFRTGANQDATPETVEIGAGLISPHALDKKALIYWGVVFYKDIFDADRWFRFCRYVTAVDLAEYSSCVDHNDSN
jgi:hypothetical protein